MNYAYVENNAVVEGPRPLPRSWRNISGLNKMSPDALKAVGWMPWVTEYLPGEVTISTQIQIRDNDILETVVRRSYTAEELQSIQSAAAEAVQAQRREAYMQEADPLFFKWQRGEATEQDWLNKVAEIKARFPK